MNDFTKTELREISRCLSYMINGGITPYSCLTIALNKKIKEMYGNYCECPESMRLKNAGDEYCVKCKRKTN